MLNWLPALILLLLQTSACPEWSGWVGCASAPVLSVVTVVRTARRAESSPVGPVSAQKGAVPRASVFPDSASPQNAEPLVLACPTRAGPSLV